MRPSGRTRPASRTQLRARFHQHAEGCCLVSFGETRVLVTASVEENRPFFAARARDGSPRNMECCPAPPTRAGNREARQGKQSGRTQEIQRLIGRSLRAVVTSRSLANGRSWSIATSSARCERHRIHLGRLGCAPDRGRQAAGFGRAHRGPDPHAGRGGVLRHPRRHAGARPRLYRG